MIRCYSELSSLKTFQERYNYLKLSGTVGEGTFGPDRWINQDFYRSKEWKKVRNQIILRDLGCDLGMDGYEIYGKIIIHHMNPISVSDILSQTPFLINPEYLICTSVMTHNAIHYGDESLLAGTMKERTKYDTCPWKKK